MMTPPSGYSRSEASRASPEAGSVAVYLFGPAVVKISQREGVWKLTPHGQARGKGMAECRHIELAAENAARNGVAYRNCWHRDWLNFDAEQPYDVMLCNPPFCKAGTADRRSFIRQLIQHGPRFLRPGGHLLFVQSSMANFALTERKARPAAAPPREIVERVVAMAASSRFICVMRQYTAVLSKL